MHMCYFRVSLQFQNGVVIVNDKPKVSQLISLSECQLQAELTTICEKLWEMCVATEQNWQD